LKVGTLAEILINLSSAIKNAEETLTGLAVDSRLVRPGYVFFAVPGTNTDGHLFIPQAVERGAVCVVLQNSTSLPPPETNVSWILVDDSRRAMAQAAAHFHDYPSKKMRIIGVTGTNGKTTTCFYLHNILEEAGFPAGLLTTVKNLVGNEEFEAVNTTEESLHIYQHLKSMEVKGMNHAVMEISSHGLALGKVDGMHFSAAIITNIIPEHLEFHGSFEHYLNSKKLLLQMIGGNCDTTYSRMIAVNRGDAHAFGMVEQSGLPFITFGLTREAEVRAENIHNCIDGSTFILVSPWGDIPAAVALPGSHNVCNALGAAALALEFGIDIQVVGRSLLKSERVPGRWERVLCGQPFEVVVDFAHNWHGLERTLTLIREVSHGKVITVFGCGGERDIRKRPLMGEVAARYSDVCILTADNPRHEDPLETVKGALEGVERVAEEKTVHRIVLLDRTEAIQAALSLAEAEDVVFLAGKGPERLQIYADTVVPHNDAEVARRYLKGKAS